MDYILQHKRNEQKDRRKSAFITALCALLVFLAIFFYTFTKEIPKTEEITTMLINFGDNENGMTSEEPSNQEGSLASNTEVAVPEPVSEPKPTPVIEEKVLTGQNKKVTIPKTEKKEKPTKSTSKSATPQKKASAERKTNTKSNAKGDGRGTAAVGNLIRGRGANAGSQGANATSGNAGDPLGGDSNGDSRIGVDRNLVGFIPGTMGRGGAQPAHSCSVSGTITIAYVVDKAGNVTSARRSGGVSDPCVVAISVSWVKKYVKAERANTSSTGSYKITF